MVFFSFFFVFLSCFGMNAEINILRFISRKPLEWKQIDRTALQSVCTGFSKQLSKICELLCKARTCYWRYVSLMHFIGLPASLASKENAQGFPISVSFILPEHVVLPGPSSSMALAETLPFVAAFWVCDKTISTTPVTRQQNPNANTTAAKRQILECLRFT